eukprot:GHVR01153130.1.p1 GENE.GHVR01153130.1~~GHVR01153130.1.p1  ORF type:complete len:203 (+),score=29.70 GHVR01153130.1:2305-2913(+)
MEPMNWSRISRHRLLRSRRVTGQKVKYLDYPENLRKTSAGVDNVLETLDITKVNYDLRIAYWKDMRDFRALIAESDAKKDSHIIRVSDLVGKSRPFMVKIFNACFVGGYKVVGMDELSLSDSSYVHPNPEFIVYTELEPVIPVEAKEEIPEEGESTDETKEEILLLEEVNEEKESECEMSIEEDYDDQCLEKVEEVRIGIAA